MSVPVRPGVGQPVTVQPLGAPSQPARVMDCGSDASEWLVVHPRDVDLVPDRGSALLLGWTTTRGCHQLLTTFDGRVPMGWWLRPTAAGTTDQRRQYARVPTSRPVALHAGEVHVQGSTIDIGEGGMAVAVPLGHVWSPGQSVRLRLLEEEFDVAFDADVVRTSSLGGDRIAVALRFHEPVPQAKWLRRQVLHWQALARKVAQR